MNFNCTFWVDVWKNKEYENFYEYKKIVFISPKSLGSKLY